MPRMPAEQRRRQLVEAAVRVVARSGVAAATTRAVAAEAQVPLGTLHYVFASQDELMHAVVEHVTDGERRAAELTAHGAASLHEALLTAMDSYLDLLESDPDREQALLELALYARRENPEGLMRTQYAVYRRTVVRLLEDLAAATGSAWRLPVEQVARRVVTLMDGLTLSWLADGDTAAARADAAFFASTVAAMARPAPGKGLAAPSLAVLAAIDGEGTVPC